jgi:hypothetical protein
MEQEGQTHYHSIRIGQFEVQELFWLHATDFKLKIGGRKTEYIQLNRPEELKLSPVTQTYEETLELVMEDESESGFVLKLLYNTLGNLT